MCFSPIAWCQTKVRMPRPFPTPVFRLDWVCHGDSILTAHSHNQGAASGTDMPAYDFGLC